MKTQDSTGALLALIESDRVERCRRVQEPLAQEARALLAKARRSARARVSAAIAEERAAHAARVAAAQARLATALRMARQRRLTALLAEAWERLPAALEARWADENSRRQWIDAATARADEVLPPGEHEVELDPVAGVRVACRHVVMDATVAGLLSDRLSVQGRLLYHFEEAA